MLEFGDLTYYFDLDAIEKAITIVQANGDDTVTDSEQKTTFHEGDDPVMIEVFEKTYKQGKEINATKYDLLKTFIEYIIDSEEGADTTLGAERALRDTSLGYKIVFNTLLKENIIKEL